MSDGAILTAFRVLLWLYPGEFRDEYGREMAMVLADRYRDAANTWERLLIVLEALMGILFHAPKEHCSMILRDLRYALRMLIGSPVFAVVAILSLAIGIGANTAIFAVAKTVLLNTLPVKNAERLRMLTWVNHGREQPVPPVWGDVYTTKDGGLGGNVFSYPVLEELRKKSEVFESLIAFKDVDMTATVDGHPELIATEMVSGGALPALGVEPILGRTLTEADDAGAGAAPAAVITEDYWTEKFGRSAGVLGRMISLNGTPVSIVGVTPAQFTGLTMGSMVRVFVPLTLQPLLTPRAQIIGAGGASLLSNPQSWWVVVMARLRQGVPEAKTQAVLDVVLRQTAKATLPQAKNLDQFHLVLLPGSRGLDNLAGFTRPSYLLLGLSGLVLLLACLNLANLLLARAASRQREISTRLALGAGRGGILRQLLTESLLLSLMGGLAGLGCAFLSRNVILELLTDSRDHAGVKADFDLGVLAFTVGLSIATGLVFGATPIWRAMRADLNSALKAQRARLRATIREETLRSPSGGRLIPRPSCACSLKAQRARVRAAREERSTLAFSAGRLLPRPSCACSLKNASHATMGRRRVRLGQVLVVMQIALSAILLIGAGLLVRTLVNLNDMPLGFRSDHLLLFKINPPRARYANAQMRALYTQLEQKFATIPGVRQVTISDISLIGDGHSGATFHVSGRPVREHSERVQTNGVGSDFFQTMGIPILAGRAFNVHDNVKSLKVAVVNRALVKRFFPNENPLGETFEYEDADGPVQIVGIAADTRYADLRSETPPMFFVPYQQRDWANRMLFEIRTMGEPFAILNQARQAVESIDRDLPLIEVQTQEQKIQASLSSERVFAQLTSGFGLMAVVLAGIGIYGLMAYTVARRTGEIGIRMALGARVGQVLAAVLWEALWVAVIGLAVGIGASFWLDRLVGSMLYGLKSTDPVTIAGTGVVLICITLLAGFGPARRASRIDPLRALRHE